MDAAGRVLGLAPRAAVLDALDAAGPQAAGADRRDRPAGAEATPGATGIATDQATNSGAYHGR